MSVSLSRVSVKSTIQIIGGKWKILLLCYLMVDGPKRTSDFRRAIPEIIQKVLTEQLRELEDDNIISRTVYEQVPPKVAYELSEIGQSLKGLLEQLWEWGERYQSHRR